VSTRAVAKHPKPAKPAAPSNAKLQKELNTLQGEVRKLESTATKKHPAKPKAKHKATATAKHKPAATAKHGGTKRGLALADGVACCAAEALAASLRLAGHQVDDFQVLALFQATGADPDEGATLLATLEAAARHGLAGVRLAGFRPAPPAAAGVLLGVQLPAGPHTVTLDPEGRVWSWGRLHALEELGAGPAEEAWAVSWS
jgi:hypothetical protein